MLSIDLRYWLGGDCVEDLQPSEPASTIPDYEQLLRTGIQAARRGNVASARLLFRAVIRERPTEIRAWLALAGVAENRADQRAALEQALALDPNNELARRAIARLNQQQASTSPPSLLEAVPPPDDNKLDSDNAAIDEQDSLDSSWPEHADEAATPYRHIPGWLVIVALAAAIGLAAGYFLLPLLPRLEGTATLEATPTLRVPIDLPTASPPQMTAEVLTNTVVIPTTVTSEATPIDPTAEPSATPALIAMPEALAMGTLQEYNEWSATLLRPDYAMTLDGSLGDLQPGGRFVLALLSVSNGGTTARPIPNDLFVLIDNQGRNYRPVPEASSIYLAIFGRGQRGDLALEDAIAPGGGIVSVPIIFDVPLNASGLILTIAGNRQAGWQIQETTTPLTPFPEVGP